MKNILIIGIMGILLFFGGLIQSAIAYDYVYIDDGESHLIGDSMYQNNGVILDYYIANNPGTHFQIVDGGNIDQIGAYNNASIEVIGGNISHLGAYNNGTIKIDGGLISYGAAVSGNSQIVVNAGTIGTIWSYDQSIAEIKGGTVNGWILASGNSTIDIRGGVFENLNDNISDLITANSGTIYIYGNNFSINGNELNYGDSIRPYGVIGGSNYDKLVGIITGTLSDGSSLNCEFAVPRDNPGGADIIVIPEPATLCFLALGSLFLRIKR